MASESGELKKLLIEGYKKPDYSGSAVTSFTVMFNPTSFSEKFEVEYEERQGAGDSASPQVFKNIKPQEYSFEFLFDGTGTAAEKVDVQQAISKFLKITGKIDGEIHRPFYLKISWGALLTKCVLKSAETTYTLFKADGFPLRAKIKATFAVNVEDTLRVAEDRMSSPDLTHRRIVQEGDHLPLMCHQIYGEPGYYLEVARFNRLDNYRDLIVGQELLFPPLRVQTDA